jgi:CDP-glycerol glycerophosphotransferase (TagB/SpsB family)
MAPHLVPGRVIVADGADICRYLAASDVMITDHSSSGFEYLLLDRPLIRIHLPELIALANIHSDYVSLLTAASESVREPREVIGAVERALVDPSSKSASRRTVAAELFHQPGTATNRCVAALYEAIQLDPVAAMPSLHSVQPSFRANG